MFIQILISKKNSFFAGCTSCYFYYKHGPLARIEYGNDKVQGVDFAYTLQGWIKAVNSETLDSTRDIGNDGKPGNINENFASDAFGYSLNYYNGDYSAIDNSRNNCLASKTNMSNLATDAPSLYNGNINYMVTTITNPTSLQKLAQLTAYRYDQLNRLLQMRAFDTINLASNAWNNPGIYNGMYFNSFAYDPMGNMKTATANNQAGVAVDNQDYNYQTIDGHKINNRLYSINDSAGATSGNDLLDQIDFDNTASTINTANNYSYNEIGELKANKQDSIADIEWTVYGKIKSVTRVTNSTKKNLKFDYDPSGNRVAKHVYDSDNIWLYSEYYTRDAQGNIMSAYKYTYDDVLEEASYKQTEAHIYGSSSLGIDKTETELIGSSPLGSTYTHTLGNKQFTGSNHLGNTLVIFTDKKIQHDDNTDGIVDYYTANIVAANDYAPFGGLLTERTFNKGTFPNSFNGKRDDAELGDWQDYGMRMYSPWERKFPTVDPLFRKYPELSTYQFASNTPIRGIDLDGNELVEMFYLQAKYLFGKTMLNVPSVVDVSDEIYKQFGVLPQTESMVNYVKKCATDPIYYIKQLTLIGVFEDYKKEAIAIYNGVKDGDPKAYVDAASLALNLYFIAEGIRSSVKTPAPIDPSSNTVKSASNEPNIVAANGTNIKGFVSHGVIRAIQRGIKPTSILDAMKNPLKICEIVVDEKGRPSQRLIGRYAEVVVNPETGKVISVNATSTKKAAKLLKDTKNENKN